MSIRLRRAQSSRGGDLSNRVYMMRWQARGTLFRPAWGAFTDCSGSLSGIVLHYDSRERVHPFQRL